MRVDSSVSAQKSNPKSKNAPQSDVDEMVKPSILWMAVPILLIAVAIFLAR
jgi:hypothetical protein